MYENLNKPFKIRNLTIKNRITMSPMGIGFVYKPTGEITEAGHDYFVRRAKGGAGIIFMGAFGTDLNVDPDNPLAGNPMKDPESFVRSSRKLTDAAHACGTKLIAQATMGVGRNYPYFAGPSELPVHEMPEMTCHALTVDEIHEKERQMIEVAKLIKEGGYDGFELHALHWGYLLDEFATSYTNHRTDEYGGSLENRLRVCKELIEGIREACGEDFVITVRLGLKSYVKSIAKGSIDGSGEVGRTVEEAIETAKLLESWGLDAISADVGNYESFYYACPPMYVDQGFSLDLARQVKEAVNIPVLLGGRMSDPDIAEKAVAEGKIDGIVCGRPMLADEAFAEKVLTGNTRKIRPCIACNQGCYYRLLEEMKTGSCAVNPSVDYTDAQLPQKAECPKNILVVGGGVAGMEFARTVALRGHNVCLFEKTDKLGGNLLPAGNHAFKRDLHRLAAWYENELNDLGVKVTMNTEVNPNCLADLKPDVVILAAGSVPVIPKVEGVEKAVGCLEVLNGEKTVGKSVVVVGGGLVGCEIAYDFAKDGKDVTIVEGLGSILSGNVPYPNKMFLIDSFEKFGTKIMTGAMLKGVTEVGALVEKDGEILEIPADDVVISIGFKPVKSMAEEIRALGYEVIEIGDGEKVGNVMTSIWSAFDAAKEI